MNVLKIISAKKKYMDAADASGVETSNIPSSKVAGVKERKLSAADLKAEAEEAQIEEAVQTLVKDSGVSIQEVPEPASVQKKAKPRKVSGVKKERVASKPVEKKPSSKPQSRPKEKVAPQDKAPVADHREVFIYDYSEKSFAVFGNTKPIKKALSDAGGRFNPNLHPFGPESSVPGWIFPLKARKDVERIIV